MDGRALHLGKQYVDDARPRAVTYCSASTALKVLSERWV